MRRYWWVVVLLIALPLLVVSSLAGLYFFATRPDPVGRTLVYEFVEPADAQAAERTAAAINRRFVVPPYSKPLALARAEGTRILVDVYGDEPARSERVKRLTGALGTLEFRILANRDDHAEAIAAAERQDGSDVREGEKSIARWVPVKDTDDAEEGLAESPELAVRETSPGRSEVLVAIDPFNVTGEMLAEVRPGYDARLRPCLEFTMNARGATLLSGLTSLNVPDPATGLQRRLAIILNGEVMTAPSIQSTIGDRGEIGGNFSEEDVLDLVGILNTGSLPGAIRLAEERAP